MIAAQFWGVPAMALMTVGAGTLVLGQGLIGPAAVGEGDLQLISFSHDQTIIGDGFQERP